MWSQRVSPTPRVSRNMHLQKGKKKTNGLPPMIITSIQVVDQWEASSGHVEIDLQIHRTLNSKALLHSFHKETIENPGFGQFG